VRALGLRLGLVASVRDEPFLEGSADDIALFLAALQIFLRAFQLGMEVGDALAARLDFLADVGDRVRAVDALADFQRLVLELLLFGRRLHKNYITRSRSHRQASKVNIFRIRYLLVMRLAFALIVAVVLGACQSDFDKIPGQDLAMTLVWHDLYLQEARNAPSIGWVYQPDLDCVDGRGFKHGSSYGAVIRNTCVYGVTWPDWAISQVAHPDDFSFSQSAFSHELWHMKLYLDGDDDPHHLNQGFGISFGHPYGMVDFANDTLKSNGL
jgi:hypothetical protein